MNNHSMAQEGGLNQLSHVTGSLPKPYYEDSKRGIVIYHADCREVLPHLPKVDLLLTDPPYGIGEAKGRNKTRGNMAVAKDYGNLSWDDKPIEKSLIDSFVAMSGHAVIWGGNYYQLPPTPCWLVWDKLNGDNDFADCELAWSNKKMAVRRIVHRWNGMLREGNEQREHPTQKPLQVIKWCLEFFPQSQTVLDPFMGSGTTLVACKELGKRCIGIELEERYCEIAARRLSQDNLFEPEELSQLAGGGK